MGSKVFSGLVLQMVLCAGHWITAFFRLGLIAFGVWKEERKLLEGHMGPRP